MVNSLTYTNLSKQEFDQLSPKEKGDLIRQSESKTAVESSAVSKTLIQRSSDIQIEKNDLNSIPNDVLHEIFSYFNSVADLRTICLVSKNWRAVTKEDNELLWKEVTLRQFAFGKEKWAKYFGDIGEAPELPKNIYEILKSPSPVDLDSSISGKSVAQTHMLVLIPKKVNGSPLTLNCIGELVKAPKEGKNKTCYSKYSRNAAFQEHGNKSVDKSYWVLMTKNIIKGSRRQRFSDQEAMVAELAGKSEVNYQVPKVLEVVVCIFANYVDTGKHLFNRDPFTYTRCQEKVHGYQIVVGGFGSGGLYVFSDDYVDVSHGVAALRKF